MTPNLRPHKGKPRSSCERNFWTGVQRPLNFRMIPRFLGGPGHFCPPRPQSTPATSGRMPKPLPQEALSCAHPKCAKREFFIDARIAPACTKPPARRNRQKRILRVRGRCGDSRSHFEYEHFTTSQPSRKGHLPGRQGQGWQVRREATYRGGSGGPCREHPPGCGYDIIFTVWILRT